jgi:hypothetical protein
MPPRAPTRALAALLAAAVAASSLSPSPLLATAVSAIPEPYAWLHGGAFGAPVPASRDDLVSYSWPPNFANFSSLQIFASAPLVATAAPAAAAAGLASLIAEPFGAGVATVSSNCSILLDFGAERGAWLELAFAAPLPACASVTASISEYNTARPLSVNPTSALRAYGGGLYRLETNALLFDGLRYAFVGVTLGDAACGPLVITGARAVAQALPLNYVGAFNSSDEVLDRVYYAGAYAVRANAQPGFFGSELLSRGDRVPPFQGDAHVAQRVGLAVFGSPPLYALARAMLNLTDSAARPVHDSNIATYPLQWVLSVVDFFRATGDVDSLLALVPSVQTILDAALADVFNETSPADLRWSGWDDRLGSGFSDVNLTPEARRYLWMTTLKAAGLFAAAAAEVPALAPLVNSYTAAVAAVAAQLRASGPDWFATRDGGYGIHACAAAITGGWTTPAERAAMFDLHFNDSARFCSFSNFDTGFLLDALAAMGREDFGAAAVRMCWGRQLAAGATCLWESVDGIYDQQLSGGDLSARLDMDLLAGASTSACHAWGAAPTAWLPLHALGVQPLQAGFARFSVSAHLLGPESERAMRGTLQRAGGRVPTPRGAIEVQHVVDDELGDGASQLPFSALRGAASTASIRLTTRVRAPPGLVASVRVPRQLGGAQLLSATAALHGGAPTALDLLDDHAGAPDAAGRRTLDVPDVELGGNELVVVAEYGASAVGVSSNLISTTSLFPPFGAPIWPAGALVIDNSTHGSWVGAVGAAGHVLFAFDAAPSGGPPTDRVSLPSFIANVSLGPGVLRALAAEPAFTQTESWLQDPLAPAGARKLGAAYVGSTGGLYGLFVDVTSAPNAPDYRVTAYAADTTATASARDGAPAAQSMFVRAADGVTRNALAPDVLVRHFAEPSPFNSTWNSGGAWGLERGLGLSLIARGAGAVTRLRFYCVSGCYASVSALFFDPVST